MRILLLDQFGEMGGAQHGLLEAAAGFADRGWKLHALIPEGPLQKKLSPLCETLAPLACGPYRPVHKTVADTMRFATQFRQQVASIGSAIRRFSIDAIYVNGPRVVPAAMWARSGRPVVFHSHSVVQQRAAAWLTGTSLRRGNATVLLSSRFVAGWLAAYVPPARMRVIYNGVSGFGPFPGPKAVFTRIGMLGRIAPEKRQMVFVEAAQHAVRQNPQLTFICCGGPVLAGRDYHEHVRQAAGISVRFMDWTEDIREFFKQVDILVVPSARYDTNPRVIVEAFAAGVPVIAFDSGGIPELIEDGISGLLVRQHTAAALADAIVNAATNSDQLNKLAHNAYARWQQHYTLPRFQSEVAEVMGGLAAEDRARVHIAAISAKA